MRLTGRKAEVLPEQGEGLNSVWPGVAGSEFSTVGPKWNGDPIL